MRIGYLGNFTAPWCTEVHVARAFELAGVEVVEYQENQTAAWEYLEAEARELDFVVWTRTWDTDPELARRVLLEVRRHCPLVGYHLDRWWGLARQAELEHGGHPFFRYCDLLCSTDGGHDAEWEQAGVEHAWYPPAVLGEEAALDVPWERGRRPELLFVGSHRGYHREWRYRGELVHWLRATFKNHCQFFPKDGDPFAHTWHGREVRTGQARGVYLNALYQAAAVAVGDSCLAGGAERYWSDRVPETIGRGGLLIHPRVEGLEEQGLQEGVHFLGYELGDFVELADRIEFALHGGEDAASIRAAGRARVLERHTYEARVARLIPDLQQRGLL